MFISKVSLDLCDAAFHIYKDVASPNTFTPLKLVFIASHRAAFVNLFILTVVDVGGSKHAGKRRSAHTHACVTHLD